MTWSRLEQWSQDLSSSCHESVVCLSVYCLISKWIFLKTAMKKKIRGERHREIKVGLQDSKRKMGQYYECNSFD